VNKVAAKGAWGTVEWAVSTDGSMPAREIFLKLSPAEKAKVLSLFQHLADHGAITNREKFRQLGEKAGSQSRGLWEFKSHQIRFFGDFRLGRRFILAHGITDKKQDKLRKSDIQIAMRIMSENDAQEHRGVQ
jgi:hypothetical protein